MTWRQFFKRFWKPTKNPGHVTLMYQGQSITAAGMLDSGAAISVLPHSAGLALGLVWEDSHRPLTLSGNLSSVPARGVVLVATVAHFPPVQLAFAWAQTDQVPLLLGQMNFFKEFNVYFFRSQSVFEIAPAQEETT